MSEASEDGAATILVVDDQDAVRRLARRMLEKAGFEVVDAASSVDALEIARARSDGFDLVLTDVQMPDMNGIELTRVLREERPDLPVVLVSGSFADVEIPSEIGSVRLLEKPYTLAEITETVGSVLAERPDVPGRDA